MRYNSPLCLEFLVVNETNEEKTIRFFSKYNYFEPNPDLHILLLPHDVYADMKQEYGRMKSFKVGLTDIFTKNSHVTDNELTYIKTGTKIRDLIDPYQQTTDLTHSKMAFVITKEYDYALCCKVNPSQKMLFRFWISEVEYKSRLESEQELKSRIE